MNQLFYADAAWSPLQENPFCADGAYGSGWSAFLVGGKSGRVSNQLPGAQLYVLQAPLCTGRDLQRLADFICYESGYGRNVILKANPALRPVIHAVLAAQKSAKPAASLRRSDPRWLVHSTTWENWAQIKACGTLLAPSVLKARGRPPLEIGLHPLLEPADYSDYVMLDHMDGCGELVVNSRQLGRICTDGNAPYTPGVRLYFDARRILADRLGVRDGVHPLKIKHALPLRYLEMAVTTEQLGEEKLWTPTSFTQAANSYFDSTVS